MPDAMQRYKQLLYYAQKLPPMPKEEHVEGNKVKGCVSQACHMGPSTSGIAAILSVDNVSWSFYRG